MTSVPIINQGSTYFAGAGLADSISQLQLVSAIAPFIQTTNALASWNTSDPPGPGSDHNLLNNNTVLLDQNTGDMSELNSLSFTDGVMVPPVAGSLWLNSSNNHLYHGAVDLEAGGGSGDVQGGNISAVNEIATYDSLTGKSIGRSGMNIKEDSFNVFLTSGPIPTLSGGAQENVIMTAATIASPVANSSNTFVGSAPGFSNTSDFNVGIGSLALSSNSNPAGSNTAVGSRALASTTSCQLSTAIGASAGDKLLTSTNNTLVGHRAGYSCESADSNVLIGAFAGGFELGSPVTGFIDNIFIGKQAGYASGILNGVLGNICIGPVAGENITDNTFNIYLDNSGVAGEDGVIRIGKAGIHTKNFQQGIRGVVTDAADAIPVLVSSTGQLGTTSSSAKYKDNIRDLVGSDIIYQLRPVEFNFKSQPNHKSLGLIAEEVEKVYPEMCIYQPNAETGDKELLTVDYQRLSILLLAEIQKLRYDVLMLKRSI